MLLNKKKKIPAWVLYSAHCWSRINLIGAVLSVILYIGSFTLAVLRPFITGVQWIDCDTLECNDESLSFMQVITVSIYGLGSFAISSLLLDISFYCIKKCGYTAEDDIKKYPNAERINVTTIEKTLNEGVVQLPV